MFLSVCQIRQVLNAMRRGENLRVEVWLIFKMINVYTILHLSHTVWCMLEVTLATCIWLQWQ